MRQIKGRAGLLAGVLAISAASAAPGVLAADFETAEELVSVADRSPEGFGAQGVRVGSFIFYPSVTIAVAHDDNVFAKPEALDDTIYAIRPELLLVSDWSRHELEFFANGEGLYHEEYSSEDQENYHVGARTTLDFSEFLVKAEASHRMSHEQRGTGESFEDFREPVEYETAAGRVGVEKRFNRIYGRLTGGVTHDDYHDAVDLDGEIEDQDYRDGFVYDIVARVGYEVSPATSVFVEGSQNWRDYEDDTFDSEGQKILGGVEFEMTRLVRGEVGLGWMTYDLDDEELEDFDSFAYNASLYWDPTELLSFHLEANREIGISSEEGSSSKITSDVSVSADYELRRNLILSGLVGWEWVDYQDIPREDEYLRTEAEIEYLVNSYMSVLAKVANTDFSSNEEDLDYDRTIYSGGVRLQY